MAKVKVFLLIVIYVDEILLSNVQFLMIIFLLLLKADDIEINNKPNSEYKFYIASTYPKQN